MKVDIRPPLHQFYGCGGCAIVQNYAIFRPLLPIPSISSLRSQLQLIVYSPFWNLLYTISKINLNIKANPLTNIHSTIEELDLDVQS